MSVLDEVRWLALPSHADARGVLTSVESGIDTPFEIKRVFYMHHIVTSRGGHAHRDTDQIVVAVAGNFKIDVLDGIGASTYHLHDATNGLYIPRMVFTRLYDFSPGAVCLVFANTHYDMTNSIRSWEDYLAEIGTRKP